MSVRECWVGKLRGGLDTADGSKAACPQRTARADSRAVQPLNPVLPPITPHAQSQLLHHALLAASPRARTAPVRRPPAQLAKLCVRTAARQRKPAATRTSPGRA